MFKMQVTEIVHNYEIAGRLVCSHDHNKGTENAHFDKPRHARVSLRQVLPLFDSFVEIKRPLNVTIQATTNSAIRLLESS